MLPFTKEHNSNWDQISESSSFKDLDLHSFFLEDANTKNEENFSFSFNMKKDLDNSISKSNNQKKTLDEILGIKKNNFITNEKVKKIYFELINPSKFRGRKTTRQNNFKHDKYAKDNLLRKIKVHSINFIIDLVNLVLMNLGEYYQFRQISYEFKKDVKYYKILSLKKMTIKDILCQKLSSKFKKDKDKDNTNIFESIKDKPIIKNLISSKYLEIFEKLYFNNKKKIINLKDYGSDLDIIIKIPKKIEIFEDLVRINKNNSIYINKLKECVNNNFLNK